MLTGDNLGNNKEYPSFPEEGRPLTGVVKRFYEELGYGFILDKSKNEYFIHFAKIKSLGYRNLARGQQVRFVGKEGPKGLYAEDVSIINNI